MPRGPYQGTFQPNLKPTVVTGPDAVVYINGESDIVGCPSCSKKFDFNAYITSITVDLNVDSPPGSASISLAVPRHSIDDFYFENQPIITPMMEVEIFAKGYFLIEGVPQYYPIFWGLVTEVGNSYSGGEHTVSIQCSDILKWWELCKMNINPALTAASGQAGRSIFGNVFFGMNPFDVIWTCAQQSFGDVVVGSGSLTSLNKEQGDGKQVFQEALNDIMLYWESRFSRTRSNLLLYGTNGIAVRGDTLSEAYVPVDSKKFKVHPYASATVRKANGGSSAGQMVFDPTDPSVVAFRTQFSQAGQVNFFTSEFQTKLELANAAKEAIGYEFFMDVTGDLVFKPPFYNLDILSNKPVSWIQDIDVIDWDFSESEAEVVTQLTMQGDFGGATSYGFPEDCTPFTSVTDYHLLRKYGWRTHSYNSEFMASPLLMFYHGLDILDRINAKRHRMTVTIPMRSELRLGFPIYVAPLDQVWYIIGISHNCAFGGRATTALTLTARRGKFFAPKGIGSLFKTGYTGPSTAQAADPKPDPNTKDAKGNQKVVAAPSSKLPFKYTSKQLSQYGVFNLKVGDAAPMPPTINKILKAGQDNPFAPLILRHPKTGRAVGYPNVVMIYTRPFDPPPDDLVRNAGQKTKGNPNLKKQGQAQLKANFKQIEDNLRAMNTRTAADDARDSLLNNRYQYGLNSAGVMIYAWDFEGLFGEAAFLKSSNITTLGADLAPITNIFPKSNKTAMLRPVSDERGFEVVGHFRYGRGLSLRDGMLVYNPNEKNKKASVDIQVALSGDIFATLTSQSQGLSSLSTTYPNPIAAITEMRPDDLPIGGVINPGTNAPQFVPVNQDAVLPGTNFVDTAPLGSAEQKGSTASLEAGQLSRAVTIAELNILKDPGSQDTSCSCLSGRSDLAFMNVGYQIKPLTVNTMGGAAPAAGTLPGPTGGAAPPPTTTVGGSIAINNAIQGVTSPYVSEPVTDQQYRSALGGANVLSKIDQFLYSLYSALDKPHQEFEAALRGELLDLTFPKDEDVKFGNVEKPPSVLSPPYNPTNRLAVGDPAAFAAQANSARSDLKQQWTSFGDKLAKNTKLTKLQGELELAQKELNETNSQIDALKQQIALINTGNAHVVNLSTTSLQDQIKSLEAEAAKLSKQVKDDTQQIAQLQAKPG